MSPLQMVTHNFSVYLSSVVDHAIQLMLKNNWRYSATKIIRMEYGPEKCQARIGIDLII